MIKFSQPNGAKVPIIRVSFDDPRSPNTLDIEVAKRHFLEIHRKMNAISIAVNNLVVKDDASSRNALDMDSELKKAIKEVDSLMRDVIAEPERFVKAVRSFAKGFIERMDQARVIVKRKMIDYDNVLEIEKRKQQKAIEEANKKLQEELNKQAKESGVSAPMVSPVVLPPTDTTIRSESGAVGYTKMAWKYEILSPNDVPREMCSPDPRKITEAIRAGLRDVPGLNIFEEKSFATRG